MSERLSSSILWVVAIVLVMGVSGFTAWQTSVLEREISDANATIRIMKLEHEAATIAVTEAYQTREEVYEKARERLCKAEEAMGKDSGFCDMDLPDDLRMLWEKPAHSESDHLQSASGASRGH